MSKVISTSSAYTHRRNTQTRSVKTLETEFVASIYWTYAESSMSQALVFLIQNKRSTFTTHKRFRTLSSHFMKTKRCFSYCPGISQPLWNALFVSQSAHVRVFRWILNCVTPWGICTVTKPAWKKSEWTTVTSALEGRIGRSTQMRYSFSSSTSFEEASGVKNWRYNGEKDWHPKNHLSKLLQMWGDNEA